VPVFNGINVKDLTSNLVCLNPPRIAIKNNGVYGIELAANSYIGSIVWLQSIPISITQ
jgi:hypothetical protein